MAYEKYWGKYKNIIDKSVSNSENLMDIWWKVTADENWSQTPSDIQKNGIITKSRHGNKKGCTLLRDGKACPTFTKDDFFDYYEHVVNPIVSLVDKDVDCIIEFGSGWGRNLFYILNKIKRKDIDYYAFEYTGAGCNAAKSLARVVSDYNFYTNRFDYNNPNINLNKKYKKIVIFTRYSIEQVTILKLDFFNKLLEMKSNFNVVHQEPVGWQVYNKKELGQEKNISSKKCDKYNKNLYKILKQLEKENKIIIDKVTVGYTGFVHRSGTLIQWHKQK